MTGYEKYIDGVLNNTIKTSRYIRQQVERLEDFKFNRPDMYFDKEAADKAIQFISIMKHFLGKCAGEPFILMPWQEWIVSSIIGIKWKETGTRVCSELFIMMARKQGKSSLIAALSLYMLIVDGEMSPEIACVASSRDQAGIIFNMIKEYAKSIDPTTESIKPYRNYIKFPANKGQVKVFSSDSAKLDGLNISFGILDEGHAQKDNLLYSVLKSSMGMRTQPLMCQITTAGFLTEGYPCFETYKMSIEILAKVKTQDEFFPFLFVLDEDDDWTDEDNWIKCNPNIDVTVSRQYLRDQVNAAKNDSTQLVPIKTKNFNIWCSSSQVWIPQEKFVQCMQSVDLQSLAGKMCYIGVDLASVSDLTALAVMIPDGDKFYFKNWAFIPQDTYNISPNKQLYQKFKQEGSLIVTPGNITDYNYVTQKIVELSQLFPISGIYYDPYNSGQWAIQCTDMGFNMEPFKQGLLNFNNPTKEMEKIILSKTAIVDKSSMVLWEMGNVVLRVDYQNNCLALDTIVPTPDGMKTIADIKVGDYVFNHEGKPTKVLATTDINYNRDCYKLTFKNGAEVVADNGHQWYLYLPTTKRVDGKKKTVYEWTYRDTEWIYNHYRSGIHTIMTKPVEYTEKEFDMDPYVLGLWLGDGTSKAASFTVHTGDTEMYDVVKEIYCEPSVYIDKRENKKNCIGLCFTGKTMYHQLVNEQLLGNKHIPEKYFYGSIEQRLALIQGLMDTDGTCNKINGQCAITQCRRHIVEGLVRLLDSLGMKHSKINTIHINGGEYYHLCWYTTLPMFRLKRKLDIQQSFQTTDKIFNNPIIKIEKVDSVPTKCITVDDEKHLFLITDKYLVTGNCKPDKTSGNNKIDNIIAMTECMGGYLNNPIQNDWSIISL